MTNIIVHNFVLLIWIVPFVLGHGRMIDPPSRASAWRFGWGTPIDYNDNEGFCGGFNHQYNLNGGRCGLCGDPWEGSPREHEAGGKYATGTIVRQYTAGQIIPVRIDLNANHQGVFEFRICPNNNPKVDPAQTCLNENPLFLTDGRFQYKVPSHNGEHIVQLQLPQNLTCTQCVMQWRYVAGNNWGKCANGVGAVGCGPQEEFRACSDVSITAQPTWTGTGFSNTNSKVEQVTNNSLASLGLQSWAPLTTNIPITVNSNPPSTTPRTTTAIRPFKLQMSRTTKRPVMRPRPNSNLISNGVTKKPFGKPRPNSNLISNSVTKRPFVRPRPNSNLISNIVTRRPFSNARRPPKRNRKPIVNNIKRYKRPGSFKRPPGAGDKIKQYTDSNNIRQSGSATTVRPTIVSAPISNNGNRQPILRPTRRPLRRRRPSKRRPTTRFPTTRFSTKQPQVTTLRTFTKGRPERLRVTTSSPTTIQEIFGKSQFSSDFSEKNCIAVGIWKKVGGMDDWCLRNCLHNPPFCPESHCSCS